MSLKNLFIGVLLSLSASTLPIVVQAQDGNENRPSLKVGTLGGDLRMDGLMTEEAWSQAPLIDGLTMIEPMEGGRVTGETRIRVLASPQFLVIGIEALDPLPNEIVSTSKARDPELRAEDYVKIVLDPFLDGRTGYIFAVNPGGARYDALVARRGEGEDPQWDAVWEAEAVIHENQWTAELKIPFASMSVGGGVPPAPGDKWKVNFFRVDATQGKTNYSAWSPPMRGDFHALDRFGGIVFQGAPEPAVAKEEQPKVQGTPGASANTEK
jgi:hypothetical protein